MIDVFVVSVRELDPYQGDPVGRVIGVRDSMAAGEKLIMKECAAKFSTPDILPLDFFQPRTDHFAEVIFNTTLWTIERFTLKGENNV